MTLMQAGMFPVVGRKWKVSPKKKSVWDDLDSDSDYKPSGDEEEEEKDAADLVEEKEQEKKEVSDK